MREDVIHDHSGEFTRHAVSLRCKNLGSVGQGSEVELLAREQTRQIRSTSHLVDQGKGVDARARRSDKYGAISLIYFDRQH